MRQVRFLPEAVAEVRAALEWYEQQLPGLAAEFSAALTEIISRIVANPLQFPRLRDQTHRAIFRRFPYGVYFRLRGNAIVVLAVQHGRRNPRRWQSRR
jgi:toxin ParE1/3/4